MNISEPFIHRPVATTLLTIAIAMAGAVAYSLLPVSPLPQVDFPTINVQANLPGASPETMASSVATPLERQFGRIAAVTEMTSTSTLGGTGITLQFELNRDINAAAREVEAAINAARGYLPTNLPSNPSYRKVNPAEQQIFQLALTSDVLDRGQLYDAASTIIVQKLSQIRGVGQVNAQGGALPGVRVELNPMALNKYGIGLEQVRERFEQLQRECSQGAFFGRVPPVGSGRERSDVQSQGISAADRGVQQRRPGASVRYRGGKRRGRGSAEHGYRKRPTLGERRKSTGSRARTLSKRWTGFAPRCRSSRPPFRTPSS